MYNNEEKVLIWLDLFEFLSLKKKSELLEHYENLEDLWNRFKSDKDYLQDLIGKENYSKMLFSWDYNFVNNYIRNYDNLGIKLVTIKSNDYPLSVQ